MSTEPGCNSPRPAGGPGVTRFADRGGHRLSYESSGAPDGIPVLALHDLLADRGQLRALSESPYDALFRVTLPDARGHGASPMLSGSGYPARELAADVLTVLDAERLPAVHLVGLGWGAATALAVAVAAPERVTSLVLAGPYLPSLVAGSPEAAAHQPASHHLDMMQEAAALADKGQTDPALDLFFGTRLGADWRDRFSKPRLGAIRRAAGNLGPLLFGIVGDVIDPHALNNLDMPIALLVKDDAAVLERLTGETLASLMPHARMTTLPPVPNDPLTSGSEWTEAIVKVLLVRGA